LKRALIFTIILLMISALTTQAQVEKGKLFVAGSSRIEFNFSGEKNKTDGNLNEGSEESYIGFEFLPKVGYMVINNLSAGIFIDTEFSAYNYDTEDEGEYDAKETKFVAGPFARYYIPVSDKLIPFAEAQAGFGINNNKDRNYSTGGWDSYNEKVFTYRFGGGVTFFFNDKVGADLFLGFNHESYKNKDNGYVYSEIYNEFILQVGIVVMLGK
jgi:hypothetical protein